MPKVSKEQKSELAEFILQVEAALPPEQRTVGKFLVLARYTALALESAKLKIAKTYIGEGGINNPQIYNAPRLWSSPYVFIRSREYVPQALFDLIADTEDYLRITIPLLEQADPNSPAPEYAWPLFYLFPKNEAGALVTPVFTVPMRLVHEIDGMGTPDLDTRIVLESIREAILELPETVGEAAEVAADATEVALTKGLSLASNVVSSGLGIPILVIGAALGVAATLYLTSRK
jgi:hypothetical protein